MITNYWDLEVVTDGILMVRPYMTWVRVQYDNEAVTLKQTKDIPNKKINIDDLLPQTLKSMLLIPDYDSNDNSDKHVVNNKYVDSKTFTLVLIWKAIGRLM